MGKKEYICYTLLFCRCNPLCFPLCFITLLLDLACNTSSFALKEDISSIYQVFFFLLFVISWNFHRLYFERIAGQMQFVKLSDRNFVLRVPLRNKHAISSHAGHVPPFVFSRLRFSPKKKPCRRAVPRRSLSYFFFFLRK